MTSVFYLKCTNIHILVIVRTQDFLKVNLKQINQLEITLRQLYTCCTLTIVLNINFYILWKQVLAIFLSVCIIRVCSLRNSN